MPDKELNDLRNMFAGQALQGMLAHEGMPSIQRQVFLAKLAYSVADTMIKEMRQ